MHMKKRLKKNPKKTWKLFKKTLGFLLLVIGILGILLPVLHGILFIVIGVALIESERLNNFINSVLKRFNKQWDINDFLSFKFKKTEDPYKKYNIFLILLRYLIALGLILTLPVIYKILTPATVYPVAFLLNIIYNQVEVVKNLILINGVTAIEIISSCVAGSAFLLLIILNLAVPMKPRKRFLSLLSSLIILYVLNILRIFFFSILLEINFTYFDFTHKLFWYALSIVFVIAIWFFIVYLSRIREVPVYSDIRYILKNIFKKK